MKQQYSAAQLSQVIDQALVYQCACPAQVCSTLLELRELHDYQMNCANTSDTDRRVHEAIAAAAERAHAEVERCLTDVLAIEGWDTQTLRMPESLRKKPRKPL